jgi:hypothetical protein
MFKTKPINCNVTSTPKPPKHDNVPINMAIVVIIHSQQLKQHMFKEKELVKAKGAKD